VLPRLVWLVLGALAAAQPAPASRFVPLPVPDFAASLVAMPEGGGKLPVLVVTHGAGGTAEAHCELWARIVRSKAILLCVRGRPRSPNPEEGEYYPDHLWLERETFAALAALRARYPERIAGGPVFYAGFSQGATMGALMLVLHAQEVSRLVLVEGGFAEWNVPRAKAFREHGGERVLFVCGRKDCAEPARISAHWFKMAGVPADVEYIPGAGHTHDARVEARILSRLPWLTTGDPRWEDE
jgi:predicted esterase